MSSTPQVDHPLPDFASPAVMTDKDGKLIEYTLTNADFHGRPFVMFFYPKDATSGCTIEVCGFRDLYPEFQRLDIAVVGVSRDSVRSHMRFIEHQTLPYPLISDLGGALIREWGLLIHKTMYGKPVTSVARHTFVVDGKGVVRKIYEKVTPLGHAQQVLEFAGQFATSHARG